MKHTLARKWFWRNCHQAQITGICRRYLWEENLKFLSHQDTYEGKTNFSYFVAVSTNLFSIGEACASDMFAAVKRRITLDDGFTHEDVFMHCRKAAENINTAWSHCHESA